MRWLPGIPVLLFLLAFPACGGDSPRPPAAPTPVFVAPAPPPPWTLSGRVVATLTSTPVAHAHVDAFIASADTDADGRFTLTAPTAPGHSQAITVTAAGYRPRETVIKLPRTTEPVVDLVSTSAPFDETFYNELARGALEYPGEDYQLFRWPAPLKFYFRTVDEFGRPLSPDVVQVVERGIRQGVQYYTGGAFSAEIEEGTATHQETVGWVNVVPEQDIPGGDYCGLASSVGGNPNTMHLRVDRCGCGSIKIPIAVVEHEVGHVVGMFHVNGHENLMSTPADYGCKDLVPTAKEQYHARLIYARPRGNRSPDRDPGDFLLARPGGGWAGGPGMP